MKYYCRRCGASFETDDVTEFFCKECRKKNKEEPNKEIMADVRAAMAEGLSYGEYKGGKKRRYWGGQYENN